MAIELLKRNSIKGQPERNKKDGNKEDRRTAISGEDG